MNWIVVKHKYGMRPIYLIRSDTNEGEVRVDRFPEQPRVVHTLNIHSADFVGTVTVEATIKMVPEAEDWFVVHEEVFEPFDQNQHTRRNRLVNLTGVFISMRATAEREPSRPYGIIDRVTII